MKMITLGEDNDIMDELISQRDIRTAFAYVLRNKHLSITSDQATVLLNNLNTLAQNSAGSTTSDIGRLYKRMPLPSYGSLAVDGPMAGVDLPRLESLVAVDPQFLLDATALDEATFTSLEIPNEFGVRPSAELRKEDLALKGHVGALFAALNFAAVAAATGDTGSALGYVAVTAAVVAATIVAESPAFFNGEMGRAVGWAGAAAAHALDPAARERAARQEAATFVVAYLLGCPVQTVSSNPADPATRMRFRYPDAPRVDLRDPAMQVHPPACPPAFGPSRRHFPRVARLTNPIPPAPRPPRALWLRCRCSKTPRRSTSTG